LRAHALWNNLPVITGESQTEELPVLVVQTHLTCADEIIRQADERGRTMARDFAAYGTTLPSLAERLAVEKEQLEMQKDLLEAQFDELHRQTTQTEVQAAAEEKIVLKSVPPDLVGTTLKDTVDNLAAEVGAFRARAPVEVVPAALLERMEKFPDRAWDQPGTDAQRAVAFLDFLIEQPGKLLERFRKLVHPLADFISGYPAGARLLKFVGIDRGRNL